MDAAPNGMGALEGTVMTVQGPVPAGNLGITMVGETLLATPPAAGDVPEPLYPELWDRPVTLDALGRLRRDVWSSRDNWDLSDPDLTVDELARFQRTGGRTVVEAPHATRRDVEALREISQQSGVNVIATLPFPPITADAASSRDLATLTERLVAESNAGIAGTSVRPGVLGPLDMSDPHRPTADVLASIVAAQRELSVPLFVRSTGGTTTDAIISLREAGADPATVILDVDVTPDPSSIEFGSSAVAFFREGAYGSIAYSRLLSEALLRAAEDGYYLAFASFGFEVFNDRDWTESPRDPQRVAGIGKLIEKGHLHQILLGQGIHLKMQLRRYGSWGYGHIIEHVVPMMEWHGLAPKEITTMLIWNPARALVGA